MKPSFPDDFKCILIALVGSLRKFFGKDSKWPTIKIRFLKNSENNIL